MTNCNLLIVDNSIHDYQVIIQALQTDTQYILFDGYTDTYDTLKTKITELNTPNFNSVGIIQHNMGGGTYSLFRNGLQASTLANVEVEDPNLDTWSEYSNFITYLKTEYSMVNFDLMACALYYDPNWKYVIDTLETRTGVNIRASKDDTGSAELGGNWFLETDSVNLKDVYFTDAIDGFKGVLRIITATGTFTGTQIFGISMSSTGQYVSTVGHQRPIYISSNYGVNFLQKDLGYPVMRSISLSSSGQYQTAVEYDSIQSGNFGGGGKIWISSDFGNNWVLKESLRRWYDVSISSTGQYQTAVVYSGNIFISSDYGMTWTAKESSRDWNSVSISSTGQYQTAVVNYGSIFISSDYGMTWTAKDSSRQWLDVSISSTGQYQTAVVYTGNIFISSDYGMTWTAKESSRNWAGISISSSGQYQSANGYLTYIYISSDYGMTWTAKGPSLNWGERSISISSNGKYQITNHYNNNMYYSRDYGNNWSIYASYDSALFVSIGSGTNSIAYSYDGIVWNGLGTSIFSNTYGGGVAYSLQLNRWVAVGSGTNTIAYSTDGINWTAVTNSSSIFSDGKGVAYSAQLSRWVATGYGTNTLAYSADGISWTGLGKSIFSGTGYGVAYSQQLNRWVAVGSGTNTIAYSTDGITWTGIGTSIFNAEGLGIAYSPQINRWVAVGYQINSIAYSSDGISWIGSTNSRSIFSEYARGIAYSAQLNRWVAVGYGIGSGANNIAYSSNGIDWIGLGTSIFTGTGWGVTYSEQLSRWVAVGQGTNKIAYSTDGINWTAVTNSTSIFSSEVYGVAAEILPSPTLSWSNITKNLSDNSFGLVGSLAPTSNATTSYGLSKITNWINYSKNQLYSQLSGSSEIINSTTSLINTNNYTYIQSLLGLTNMSQLKLQYKGSIDGMTANAFHSKVANIAPLFIIIKNTAGYIATAYSTIAYSDTSNGSTGFTWRYAPAGTCWVNNLYNPTAAGTYSVTKYTNQTNLSSSIYDHKDYGLRFGGSPTIGIGLGNGPTTVFTAIQSLAAGPYTGATGTILFGGNETTLADFECYSIEAVDLTYKAAYSETANKQSLLINSSNISVVKQLLTDSTTNDTPQLKLIWKSTVSGDGWSSVDWHTRVNGVSPLLIVIKSTTGYITTAYSSIPFTASTSGWNSSSTQTVATEFSCWLNPFYNPTTGYSTVKYGNSAATLYAIYDSNANGPTFGQGYDLYISNPMNSSSTSHRTDFPYTYTSKYPSSAPTGTNTTLFGAYNFTPSEIECYMITIPNTVTVGRYGTPNWFPLTTPIFSTGDNINSPVNAFKLMASTNIDGASGGPGALITDLSQLKLIYRLSSETNKSTTNWHFVVNGVTGLLIVIKASNGYVSTSYTGPFSFGRGTPTIYQYTTAAGQVFLNPFRNSNNFSTTKYSNTRIGYSFMDQAGNGPSFLNADGQWAYIIGVSDGQSLFNAFRLYETGMSDYVANGTALTHSVFTGSTTDLTISEFECYAFTGNNTPFDSVSSTYFPLYSTVSSSLTIWYQLGSDIDGEATYDYSGYSVSMSSDGKTVAIGANGNDANGSDSGHVRVYQYINSAWTQLGSDIDGEAAIDQSGFSVSMSADGKTVAIGSTYNAGNGNNGSDTGHVRVYQYNGSAWSQLGGDINGEAAHDYSGQSVSLSSDGKTVAIGAYGNDGTSGNVNTGDNRGHVRVYQYINNAWTQLGSDINGKALDDQSGWSVSMSSDGTAVAIGARLNDGTTGTDRGHVRVYQYINSAWTQLGSDIDGEAAYDQSGWSVSMSADGKTVAIGARLNDGTSGNVDTGDNRGHVRVYQYINSAWTQLGSDIDGEAANDQSGYSVSLSANGKTVAIGAIGNDGTSGNVDTGDNRGHVRVYRYNNSAWTQLGSDIDGEAEYDNSGYSVSLSSDGTVVAIGALYNDGSGVNSGHVRVYKIDSYGNFTYTSSNTAVAEVHGSIVVIKSGGTTTLTATQSASANYTSGTTTATLTVNDPGLYTYTGHTFTNAGTTGRTGPTLSAIRSAYSGVSWAQDTTNNYLNMTTQGIQLWTVPQTGSYTFRAIGAGAEYANSNGGQGIDITTTTTLTKGEVIKILVGQKGSIVTSGGGGGATFAVKNDGTPIIVAGGGGGAYNSETFNRSIALSNATTNNAGNNSVNP